MFRIWTHMLVRWSKDTPIFNNVYVRGMVIDYDTSASSCDHKMLEGTCHNFETIWQLSQPSCESSLIEFK